MSNGLTISDRASILARLDHERRHLARDGETIEMLPSATRLGAADGSCHSVAWSLLSPETADEAIVQEIDHHRRAGVPFEWKVYGHDVPADLIERLRRHGFEVGAREAVLVFDLSEPRPWADEPEIARVVRVERPDQVEIYRQVAEEAFGRDETRTAAQLSAALLAGSNEHRGFVAYDGDEPASAGRLYTHPDSHFAGLYGGSTRPGFRGRGFYRALVVARARDAVAGGARFLQVDALPTSRPILERLGFQWLTDTWPCEWNPH